MTTIQAGAEPRTALPVVAVSDVDVESFGGFACAPTDA
jgi:hypothetical protein